MRLNKFSEWAELVYSGKLNNWYLLKTDRNELNAASFLDRLPARAIFPDAMPGLSTRLFPSLSLVRLSFFIFSSNWPRMSIKESLGDRDL